MQECGKIKRLEFHVFFKKKTCMPVIISIVISHHRFIVSGLGFIQWTPGSGQLPGSVKSWLNAQFLGHGVMH
jgi:hypothetical protein